MTIIQNYNPPPDLAEQLAGLLFATKATKYKQATATLNKDKHVTLRKARRREDMRNMLTVVDWIIENGPSSYRGTGAPGVKAAILEDLETRTFSEEFWREAWVVSDFIQVCYPEIVRREEDILDPSDPTEIHNSRCIYERVNESYLYSEAQHDGWPPLPGFSCTTDGDNWFVDEWTAQRHQTVWFPSTNIGSGQRPWLWWMTGGVNAESSASGLKKWFSPVMYADWFTKKLYADGPLVPVGGHYSPLINGALELPGMQENWTHSMDVDWLFNGRTLSHYNYGDYNRYLSNVSTLQGPRGRYRARNTSARGWADLEYRYFYPAILV